MSGNTLTVAANSPGHITLTATWTNVTYSITYACTTPTTSACAGTTPPSGGWATYVYNPAAQSRTLGAPAAISGWTFTGWTKVSGPGTISGNSVNIPAGSTGPIAVKANWSKVENQGHSVSAWAGASAGRRCYNPSGGYTTSTNYCSSGSIAACPSGWTSTQAASITYKMAGKSNKTYTSHGPWTLLSAGYDLNLPQIHGWGTGSYNTITYTIVTGNCQRTVTL